MESGPNPYDFEPTFTEEELQQQAFIVDEVELESDVDLSLLGRLGRESRRRSSSTSWCTCGNCVVMPSEKECLCCHEVAKLAWLIQESGTCVTSHQDFQNVCLNQAVLRAAHIMRRDVLGHDGQGLRDLANRLVLSHIFCFDACEVSRV